MLTLKDIKDTRKKCIDEIELIIRPCLYKSGLIDSAPLEKPRRYLKIAQLENNDNLSFEDERDGEIVLEYLCYRGVVGDMCVYSFENMRLEELLKIYQYIVIDKAVTPISPKAAK